MPVAHVEHTARKLAFAVAVLAAAVVPPAGKIAVVAARMVPVLAQTKVGLLKLQSVNDNRWEGLENEKGKIG